MCNADCILDCIFDCRGALELQNKNKYSQIGMTSIRKKLINGKFRV